ncbi:MAG TPA: asparagine synthase (glutamine-hydrolyzing) [bacterium]|mgnify:CR=1 FL=1|nr:asparagine synthase (glutamine-hydrolyzing) [bacterium]HPG45169.1 asparagine synthase (glutamine-hydrolyzing) [bacterium]HPM97411.1 asparagine synthase (glutamine-hydrolyzing) [bacterium]
MCGIVGHFFKHPEPDVCRHLDLVQQMLQSIGHRGPDGQGIYLDDRVILGHTRLSIIDPAGGHQPMSNEDQTVWLVCNGEIFNYVELRQKLCKKGHRFRTQSDNEVILHLYEEHQEHLFDQLNGQFAFAIWDSRQQRLLLARDAVGICPLFYSDDDDRLIFASEMKALSTALAERPTLNLYGLIQTFTLWCPIPGQTPFTQFNELPAGCFLDLQSGHKQIKRYWQLRFPHHPDDTLRDTKEAAAKLETLLADAVTIRLRSDVPVGAYLSGGLDSSIITALICKANGKLHTFSIGFEDEHYDEKMYQELASSFLDTDHTFFKSGNADILANLEEVVWHCEKPILRSAPTPLFLLSRAVRESGFKVVLTGEGADEFFSGYNIYKETKLRLFCERQPASQRRKQLFQRLYTYIDEKNNRGQHYWEDFFSRNPMDRADPYCSHRIRWNNSRFIGQFLHPDLAEFNDHDPLIHLPRDLENDLRRLDPLSRAHYLEVVIFLNGYLLSSQGDRMLMSHGVEGRYPFLDPRIIDFALHLHPTLKLFGLQEKYILKKAFASYLPEPIIKRRKQPYRAPIKAAIRCQRTLFDFWTQPERLQQNGLFDIHKVEFLRKKALDPERSLSAREEMALMALVTTTMLVERFSKPAVCCHPKNRAHLIDFRTAEPVSA